MSRRYGQTGYLPNISIYQVLGEYNKTIKFSHKKFRYFEGGEKSLQV